MQEGEPHESPVYGAAVSTGPELEKNPAYGAAISTWQELEKNPAYGAAISTWPELEKNPAYGAFGMVLPVKKSDHIVILNLFLRPT